MHLQPRCLLSAAMAAGALLAGACGGPEPTGPAGPGPARDAQLRITAFVVGTPIDLMVARVSAADIAVPLVFNLPVTAGVATGTLRIPPGSARTITLEAFDELGFVTHEGSATIDVQPGANPPVNIAMLPRGGDIPVTATLAEFSVIVSPSSASVPAGQTQQFTAQILDANDNPLAGTVVWAVTNPAFARIDQAGLAIGVAPGALSVVATFGGVAGLAQLTVTDGVTGTIQGTVTSPTLGAIENTFVSAGPRSNNTESDGSYVISLLPPGDYIVTVDAPPAGCAVPAGQPVSLAAGQTVTVNFTITCGLAAGSVIITEIMRNPTGTGNDGEWVELFNGSTAPVSINGWGFVNMNDFSQCVIATATIQPGAQVVVGKVVDQAANGGVPNMILCGGGLTLPNTGGLSLSLFDDQGILVDAASTTDPFPGASFGLAPSSYNSTANDDSSNWCAAVTPYGTAGNLGTPGQLNTVGCDPAVGQVIITEIMRDPAGTGDDGEWVELFNTAGQPVNIGGMKLINPNDFSECVIGTATIQPGGLVVVGRVVDQAANGGVPNMVPCAGAVLFPNAGPFNLSLVDGQEILVDVAGTIAPFPGASFGLPPSKHNSTDNDDPANWCAGFTPYGTAGNLGTPGELNPVCP